MINLNDEYFLALAINTSLPRSDNAKTEVSFKCGLASPRHSSLRPSLRVEIPAPSTPVAKRTMFAVQSTPSFQSKRNKKRRAEFAIFVDPKEQIPTPSTATPKRLKIRTPRTPLANRRSSANSTPISSPRLPDTPFSLSGEDNNWEDRENYIPYHQRPQFNIPTLSPPNPTTPSAGTPPPPPPPPPLHNRRLTRPRRSKQIAITPVSMTLYDMLDLIDWRVDSDVIRSAYRRKARAMHPDHASTTEERLVATASMQRLNAAKEVLLDKHARAEYHRTGSLPWAE